MTTTEVPPTSMFRFGMSLPTNGPFAQPRLISSFAENAERLGFDDVWANDVLDFKRDRLSSSSAGTVEAAGDQDPNFYEGLTTVAFLAGQRPRIGIGLGGLVLPLRDPRLLAKQIASLHELSGCRLTIAPAIGAHAKDFQVMQVPFDRRGRLMDEYLAVLHQIFYGGDRVSFHGDVVQFEDATLYPKPADLRIWITGESEPALVRAVKWGQGWLSSYPVPDEYRVKLARLVELASAAGRDPRTIVTAGTVFVCVARTHEDALRICERSLLIRYGSLDRGLGRAMVGDPAEVIEALWSRYSAGLRYLEVKFWAHTPEHFIEMMTMFADDVLPSARRFGSADVRAT